MDSQDNPQESDLDRIVRLISEVDGEEFLLTGLDPSPSQTPSPGIELARAAIREQRALLLEELAQVWAKTCSKC